LIGPPGFTPPVGAEGGWLACDGVTPQPATPSASAARRRQPKGSIARRASRRRIGVRWIITRSYENLSHTPVVRSRRPARHTGKTPAPPSRFPQMLV
jgi:hypothetical protein